MKRLSLLVAAVALLGVSCIQRPPETGYVVEKGYHEAYTEHYTTSVCVQYGKYGCKMSVPVPHTRYHPEEWLLKLENCYSYGEDKLHKPKCRSGWIQVSHDTWERYQVGQHFPNPR